MALDKILKLRVDAELYAALVAEAQQQRRNLSDMHRVILQDALLPNPPPPPIFFSGDKPEINDAAARPVRETVRTDEHRLGHAYEPGGPNGRCKVKDCGRGRMDH